MVHRLVILITVVGVITGIGMGGSIDGTARATANTDLGAGRLLICARPMLRRTETQGRMSIETTSGRRRDGSGSSRGDGRGVHRRCVLPNRFYTQLLLVLIAFRRK
jgi:hypothetical protein